MSEPTHKESLLLSLDALLKDFQGVCDSVPAGIYTSKEGSSSIGEHQRHILEFAKVLIEQCGSKEVDYESRNRDKRCEVDSCYAAEIFTKNIADLKTIIEKSPLDQNISVQESPGFGIEKVSVASSLGRELLFVIQHSIHHFAIIKMLAKQQGIKFPQDFGVTSATQNYNRLLSSSKSA